MSHSNRRYRSEEISPREPLRPKYSPLPTPSNGSLGSNIEAGEDQRRHQGQKEETKQIFSQFFSWTFISQMKMCLANKDLHSKVEAPE